MSNNSGKIEMSNRDVESALEAGQAPWMNRLSDLVQSWSSAQEVSYQVILDTAQHLIPCRYAVWQGFDRAHRRIFSRIGSRLPQGYVTDGPLVGRIGYETLVLGQSRSAVNNDLRKSPFATTDPEINRYGLSSYVGAAVLVDGQVAGWLAVFDDQPRRYHAGHRRILEMMARMVTLIEDHHRVEARLKKKINNDKLITSISARAISKSPQQFLSYCLKKITLWSGAGAAAIFWMDGQSGHLLTGFEYWPAALPADKPIDLKALQHLPMIGEVIEKRQPIYCCDREILDQVRRCGLTVQGDMSASLFLPLRSAGETVGICCLCFCNESSQWRKEDIAVLLNALRITAQWREARYISRELDESQALNNQMLQLSPTAIYHLDFNKNRLTAVNDYMCRYTGYSEEELLSMNPENLLTAESVAAYRKRMMEFLAGVQVPDHVEYQIRTKNGNLQWARIHSRFILKNGRIAGAIVVAHNVSEQKRILEELSAYRVRLEALVEERTRALTETNRKLKAEIAIRTRTAKELKANSERLKELNTAMGVLLDKHNEDRLMTQEHIRVNLRQLVEPYLERLAASGLNSSQKQLLELVHMNLNEVVDAPLAEVPEKYYIFSPGELQVANLIRNGKTTKYIARLLCVSTRTVESYRNSIRKKLGLQNRRVNLRTYLSAKE